MCCIVKCCNCHILLAVDMAARDWCVCVCVCRYEWCLDGVVMWGR